MSTAIANGSPSQQNVTSVGYSLKSIQTYEATITKTTQIRSEVTINLFFVKIKHTVTFTQKEVVKIAQWNETSTHFPVQNITVEPFSKMNVTFNFYQYDDINNYFLHFEIASNSTISHPEFDESTGRLVFVRKSLSEFLLNHVDFVSTLTYQHENMLKLEVNDEKFVLKNFPSSEKITGYGVDVVFGRAEKVWFVRFVL